MFGQQICTKLLLPQARCSAVQPRWIGDIVWANDDNFAPVEDLKAGQDVRRCVKGLERSMNGNFHNTGRWVKAAVDSLCSFGIPAAASYLCADAAVPGGC